MAYKMKGFSGFKGSPAKQTKFPNAPKTKKGRNEKRLAKMDAEYAKGLPARISVDNPEHAKGAEGRWERLMNDHDVDDNGDGGDDLSRHLKTFLFIISSALFGGVGHLF